MKAVIQRVQRASVHVDGKSVASIGAGMLVLLGVARGDTEDSAQWIARKLATLRMFSDESGRFTHDLSGVGGEALVVSQFTLLANMQRGTRPDFGEAEAPDAARALYETFCDMLSAEGVPVSRGVFGAMMNVELVNDGPVTLVLER